MVADGGSVQLVSRGRTAWKRSLNWTVTDATVADDGTVLTHGELVEAWPEGGYIALCGLGPEGRILFEVRMVRQLPIEQGQGMFGQRSSVYTRCGAVEWLLSR